MITNQEERKEIQNKIADVIFSYKPILIAEHIFGIWRFTTHGKHLLPANWKQKLYGIFLATVNICMFIYFNIQHNIDEMQILNFIYQIPCLVIVIQYATTMVFTTLVFNKANRKIVTALAELDNRLKTDTKFYQRASAKTKMWLFTLIVSHVCVSISDLLKNDQMDASDMLFLPLFLKQRVENLAFCIVIEMLRSRLILINGYIRKFMKEKDEIHTVFTINEKEGDVTLNLIGRPSENNMKIRDLAMMYDTVGSVCSMANNIFNFQVFMTLVSAFCYIVITIWSALYFYKTPENQYGSLITTIIWCATTLLMVAIMCFVCERLLSARNSTKILVNQLIMDYSLPKTMRLQAKAFMELIEAWPLRVLIYDMFSVDISLMLKFISVSTTYLIVIIQVSHF